MSNLQQQFDALAVGQYEKRSERRFELEGWDYSELWTHWNAIAKTSELHKGWASGKDKLIECIIDHELPPPKSALVGLTLSSYPMGEYDTYIRTGIQLDQNNGCSIDILRPDGTFFCRINISAWRDGGSVDVIPREIDTLTALGWENGFEILRHTMKPGVLIATDVRQPKEDSDESK